MVEGFGLWFGGGGRSESCLSFRWGGCSCKEVNLLADGTAQITERLYNLLDIH